MSQASPAWANRYLAVALPPFLLLAAGGLAYARRLGLVGLVLVVIMWAQDAAPVEKSNVRAVAHNIGAEPRAGRPRDLDPARDDSGAALLPARGLRYATLTGALDEVGVWDWRDGVERLEATSAERDLEPVIDAMPVGSRIVLVEPITWTLNRWRAPWTEARADPLQGGRSTSPRPAAEGVLDPADQLHAAAAEPGAGDGDGEDGLAGSVSTKHAPREKSSSSSVPPMRSASSRPIARPSPKPDSALWALPRWKRSKMCSRSSAGHPGRSRRRDRDARADVRRR